MSETLEEALAHYGVKGMKWGVRKAARSALDSAAAAGEAKLRATREKDEAIRTARARAPQLRKDLDAAKDTAREQRKVVGRREAKKVVRPVRNEYWNNMELATRKTSGEEAADKILQNFGLQPVNTRLDIARRIVNEEDKR